MQAVVNPGEAKQIEQDYAHTTLASSEIAAVTAQSTAEAVQAFIQMLRVGEACAEHVSPPGHSAARESRSPDG